MFMSISVFFTCNCPKISHFFLFTFLLLNIVLLVLSNINDPPKVLEILATEFSKIFKDDPPQTDELLPLLALPSP